MMDRAPAHTQVAINTIHHDRDHPSHIVLPLIPVDEEDADA